MDPAAPVLMYHQLTDEPDGNKYAIKRSVFQAQMQSLRDLGLRGISVGEFLSSARRGVVALTFDDGNWSDAEYAWPILDELGFSATFYVTAGRISEQRLCISWEQLRDLARSGAEIGCHGRTHCFLDTADTTVLEYEISGAKELLEDGLGMAVQHFSLPGGRQREGTLRHCAASGFRSVATSRPGYGVAAGYGGLAILDRFAIHQGQSPRYLRQVVEGNQLRLRLDRLAHYSKRRINGFVGNHLYQLGWNICMKGRQRWRRVFSG